MIYFLDYDDEFGPIDVEDRVARRNNYRLSTLKWWSRSVELEKTLNTLKNANLLHSQVVMIKKKTKKKLRTYLMNKIITLTEIEKVVVYTVY